MECVCVTAVQPPPGVRQLLSLKPDCGGEPGPVGVGLQGADGLRVHRPEAAGTAGRAGEARGGRALLVQHRRVPGAAGPEDRGLRLLQVGAAWRGGAEGFAGRI